MERTAKVGEKIQWSFDDSEEFPEFLRNKTFEAYVAMITGGDYYVYAEYGQDIIPFGDAKLI